MGFLKNQKLQLTNQFDCDKNKPDGMIVAGLRKPENCLRSMKMQKNNNPIRIAAGLYTFFIKH